MKKLQIALLGFGTVGKGVYEVVQSHQGTLKATLGRSVEVSIILVENINKHQDLAEQQLLTTDFQDVLNHPDIDVVCEAIVGTEPAATYLKKSLQAGKHIITANKEMFALHGKELKELAEASGCQIGYEATTGGGIPIIQTISQLLKVNHIHKVSAILNGTSNYILSEMRNKGLSFDEALSQAQALGYAEADPVNDIEGFDSFYKLMILSDLIFNEQPDWNAVKRVGMTNVTADDINKLNADNKRIKLVATLERIKGNLHARVEPVSLSKTHPLFAVEGVDNAIAIETDLLGQLTLTGPGAGALPTASAMLEDMDTIFTKKLDSEVFV